MNLVKLLAHDYRAEHRNGENVAGLGDRPKAAEGHSKFQRNQVLTER